MRALLLTLIFLAIFAPIYIIRMDYKVSSHIKPTLEIVSVEPVTPETTPEPLIHIHFNISDEPEPTIEPTLIPTIEPTVKPTTIIPPIDPLHTPYLLDRDEVQTFMLNDQTDRIPYTSDFMCGSFAHTVINNAWELGIVGRYTVVRSTEWTLSHAIICFPTLNDGNVFVDATAGDYWAYPNSDNHTFYTISMIDPTHHGFGMTVMDGYVIYQEYGK